MARQSKAGLTKSTSMARTEDGSSSIDGTEKTPGSRRLLIQKAATGDKRARRRLDKIRLEGKLYMRQKTAEEKALRETGDADAIARWEKKKEYWRDRDAKRRVFNSRQPQGKKVRGRVRPTQEGTQDGEMSGISDDDDSEIDEEYHYSDEETLVAPCRSLIARPAKQEIQYNEDAHPDEDRMSPSHDEYGYEDAAADPEPSYSVEDSEGGVDLPDQQDSAGAAPHGSSLLVSLPLSSSRKRKPDYVPRNNMSPTVAAPKRKRAQQVPQPPTPDAKMPDLAADSDIIDLCGSDNEIKPAMRLSQRTLQREKRQTRVIRDMVGDAEGKVKSEEDPIIKKEDMSIQIDDEPANPVDASDVPRASTEKTATATSLKKQELELKLRRIELQTERVDLEMQLLELQK